MQADGLHLHHQHSQPVAKEIRARQMNLAAQAISSAFGQ